MCVTESQLSQKRDGIRARRASSVGSSTDSLLRECPRPDESSPYSRAFVVNLGSVELARILPLRVSDGAATPPAPTRVSYDDASPVTPKDSAVEAPKDGGAVRRLAPEAGVGGSGVNAALDKYRDDERAANVAERVERGPLRVDIARDVVDGRVSALFALAAAVKQPD
jgi:hypothetical protein